MALKYKAGDRVRIKSLDWYNENKNHCGEIPLFKPSGLFVPDMSRYCNNIMTIKDICYGTCYRMKEDFWNYNWTDEMIEGLVEEEIIDIDDFQDDNEIIDVIDEYVHRLKNNECQINLPEGYQFTDENGNVINAQKIVLEKKKKEYPQSYEDGGEILDVCSGEPLQYGDLTISNDYEFNLYMLLENFRKLLICRDAYWKIAGEEMGLGKPWEPQEGVIYCYMPNAPHYIRSIFPFPTKEMRDAFKENFDKDLEICKELL